MAKGDRGRAKEALLPVPPCVFPSFFCSALAVLLASVEGFGARGSSVKVAARDQMTMKIFDWKRRDAFASFEVPAGTVLSRLTSHSSQRQTKKKKSHTSFIPC
jgi:hypothetical protein